MVDEKENDETREPVRFKLTVGFVVAAALVVAGAIRTFRGESDHALFDLIIAALLLFFDALLRDTWRDL